jgi:hypothetical protein
VPERGRRCWNWTGEGRSSSHGIGSGADLCISGKKENNAQPRWGSREMEEESTEADEILSPNGTHL